MVTARTLGDIELTAAVETTSRSQTPMLVFRDLDGEAMARYPVTAVRASGRFFQVIPGRPELDLGPVGVAVLRRLVEPFELTGIRAS